MSKRASFIGIIFCTVFNLFGQNSEISISTLNYPEIVNGRTISDSTLLILNHLDKDEEGKSIDWYYERYTYLKRVSPSTDVEVILEYATHLRRKRLSTNE